MISSLVDPLILIFSQGEKEFLSLRERARVRVIGFNLRTS